MADRPPVFRAPGYVATAPWARTPTLTDKRKRGRAGMRERRQVLEEEPYCRECLSVGKTVAADEVDHIKPLSAGGQDVRENKQALCTPCHEAKTRAERAATSGRWA